MPVARDDGVEDLNGLVVCATTDTYVKLDVADDLPILREADIGHVGGDAGSVVHVRSTVRRAVRILADQELVTIEADLALARDLGLPTGTPILQRARIKGIVGESPNCPTSIRR